MSIIGIAGLTCIIGDAASHFGCSVGVKDTVTAISIVALGTSVPGSRRGGGGGHRISSAGLSGHNTQQPAALTYTTRTRLPSLPCHISRATSLSGFPLTQLS